MNAVERATKMMREPMAKLPLPALKYAAQLSRRVGRNMEVLLTAYAAYAQIVEGLPCEDELYRVTEQHRLDFDEAQRAWEQTTPATDGSFRLVPASPAGQA